MELSNEDNLRLNVLLNQNTQAIRIDESSMTVHALTDRGEAKVKLNPNCRDERYLRSVRELVSSHVLGSPGGYPVFLKRWTRMGQARSKSLEQLLLLGEPEAVVAVVHANGLTDDLAKRAWWCMPTADNARRMLEKPDVAAGNMGPVLAAFLIEFLPFETESKDIIESVHLSLQPGLIDEQARQSLWQKARRKNAYFVGFLLATPDALPEPLAPHPKLAQHGEVLASLSRQGNRFAAYLQKVWDSAGRTFLNTVLTVLKKPNDQDVVVKLMQAVDGYFAPLRPAVIKPDDMAAILDQCRQRMEQPDDPALKDVLASGIDSADAGALLLLASTTDTALNPIFSRTDAIGSVMRRKLEPISTPLNEACQQLVN